MQQVYQYVENWLGLSPEFQFKIYATAILILTVVLLRRFAHYLVNRFSKDVKSGYHLRRVISYVLVFFCFLFLFRVWFSDMESFATYFGLLSAGLAIALRDPIVNFAGWLFLMLWRPFEVGDRIQIGEFPGDVIDIGIFQFTINEIGQWAASEQSTGRIVHIPNAKVFSDVQANYTKGFEYIWNEIPVLITFESDWKKAKFILKDLIEEYSKDINYIANKKLRQASKKYMIVYRKLTPKVYLSVKGSGVELTLRYLVSPYKRRDSEEYLWEEILNRFALNEDLDFAYPTIRSYREHIEGKQADNNTKE